MRIRSSQKSEGKKQISKQQRCKKHNTSDIKCKKNKIKNYNNMQKKTKVTKKKILKKPHQTAFKMQPKVTKNKTNHHNVLKRQQNCDKFNNCLSNE